MGRGKAVGEGQSTWAYARWLDCSAEQGVASTHETPLVHQLLSLPPVLLEQEVTYLVLDEADRM